MGWHASDTGELSFTDVEVPDENLLGEQNEGFKLIMANFQWERLTMALGAVGGMQKIFEMTLKYAKEREAFGRPIGRFQAIRHKFAEMSVKIEVSRALTYACLRKFAAGGDATREVTQAKLYTQRAICDVADEAIQIHGGYGYMREYGVERAYRDARLGPIGGGDRRGDEGDPGEATRSVSPEGITTGRAKLVVWPRPHRPPSVAPPAGHGATASAAARRSSTKPRDSPRSRGSAGSRWAVWPTPSG